MKPITDDSASHPVPPAWPLSDPAVAAVMRQMIEDGSWGRYHGPHCDALAFALCDLVGVQHVQLCSSGTAAVELCLRGLEVSPGDEVILCAYDYKANFVNVLNIGATPVLVDSQLETPIPDVHRMASAITERTKAIIVSHLHGCVAAMPAIMALAGERDVAVIEDVCQSPGAVVVGRPAGAWGTVAAFSFGGSKLLTAGRGGAVATRDARVAQRIRLYTQRGNDAYPLSEMQAAVLLPQVKALQTRNQLRKARVRQLAQRLDQSSGLSVVSSLNERDCHPAFYKVAMLCPNVSDRAKLEMIAAEARRSGVALDPAFTALSLTHSGRRFRAADELKNAERLHHSLLTLHHPVLLSGEDEIDRVAAVIARAASQIV